MSNNKIALILVNYNKPSKTEYESKEDIKLNNFTLPSIRVLNEFGYKVIMASNRKFASNLKSKIYNLEFYNSYIYRSVFNLYDNIKALFSLIRLLRKYKIELIHCHTPIGGLLGRLIGKIFSIKYIIYTAHGFHFYNEAKIKTVLFRLIEIFMSRFTNTIITINKEDFEFAKKNMKSHFIYHINGVGINYNEFIENKFRPNNIRTELDLLPSDFLILSAGDLVKNKNVGFQIKLMKYLPFKYKLLIAGKGKQLFKLRKIVRILNLTDRVLFLGYRNDLNYLMKESDLFISSSSREGLSRVIMEAMASRLICIGSNVRGIRDLIDHNKNGFLFQKNDYKSVSEIILNLDKFNLEKIKENAIVKMQDYSVEKIEEKHKHIYKELLKI